MHVIAHRGASRAFRENTLEAFRGARALGADWVELDVRRTRDGVLVVHHDAALADGRIIVELASDEVPGDVASLVAAMDACAGMTVNIEVKSDPREPDFDVERTTAALTATAIVANGWVDRVVLSSFDLLAADLVRDRVPGLRSAWLVSRVPDPVATLQTLAEHGHRILHPWDGAVTPALVDACRAAGVEVNVWTVDDPVRMAELAALGVDGICTNLPDVARHIVGD